jgi:hypothetical protein
MHCWNLEAGHGCRASRGDFTENGCRRVVAQGNEPGAWRIPAPPPYHDLRLLSPPWSLPPLLVSDRRRRRPPDLTDEGASTPDPVARLPGHLLALPGRVASSLQAAGGALFSCSGGAGDMGVTVNMHTRSG